MVRWRFVTRDENRFSLKYLCARNEAGDPSVSDLAIYISLNVLFGESDACAEVGADMTFVEAPRSVEELTRYANEVPGLKLANMLEQGSTPILPPAELESIGYKIAAYPLTLVSAAVKAQQVALAALKSGDPAAVQPLLLDFAELREVVGFEEYYELEEKYKV